MGRLVDYLDGNGSGLIDEVGDYLLSEYSKLRYRKAVNYAGGDWYIRDLIIEMLSLAPCKRCMLVEVFGGSGVISQYAPRGKFRYIVYNDVDKNISNLIKVMKDNPRELQRRLIVLPYSREIHDYMRELLNSDEWNSLDSLYKAVIVFYLLNSNIKGVLNHPTFKVYGNAKRNTSTKLVSNIIAIRESAKRLRDVTIESRDFRDIFKTFDNGTTVFYLDPPYVSRNYYVHEFKEDDVKELVSILNNIEGFYLLKLHEDELKYYEGLEYKDKRVISQSNNLNHINSKSEKWNLVLLANYKLHAKPLL